MANPMMDEDKLWEQIKKENITMHPLLWELIDHHMRNDLNLVSMASQTLRSVPEDVLSKASSLINDSLSQSGKPNEPPQDISKICGHWVKGSKSMDEFLRKLKDATRQV